MGRVRRQRHRCGALQRIEVLLLFGQRIHSRNARRDRAWPSTRAIRDRLRRTGAGARSAPMASMRPLYSNSKCYFFKGKEYISRHAWRDGAGARWMRVIHGRSPCGAGAPSVKTASMRRCPADHAAISFPAVSTFASRGPTRARKVVDAAGYPKPISPNWGWGSFGGKGISAALNSGGPYASIPAKGLGSNSNYFLYSPGQPVIVGGKARVRVGPGLPVFPSCNHLLGLSVHIIVDTDITGTNGFGFQINAYRPPPNSMARSNMWCC